MKLKQILVLLAVLAAVVGLVVVLNPGDSSGLNDAIGKKIFPSLVTEEVSTVVLNGGKEEVTLEIKDGKWVVKGRDGFPANADNIDKLVRKVGAVEALDVKTDVADKYLGRFKLLAPGSGGKEDETGTQVVFKKADGTTTASFMIGKNPPSGGTMYSNSQPQFVKPADSKDKVLVIKEAFDYFMNSITNKDWLDKTTFFKAEKIKSVTVTTDKAEDNWKIFREKEGTDATELKLADPKPGEEFDTAKGGNSGNAFSSVTFNDVATADQNDKTGLDKPLRTAVIETFDGFKYTVKIGKQVEKAVDPNTGASEEYYISVAVEANLAEKMPEPVPSPEDAKKSEEEKKKAKEDAEKAFNEALTKNKEKLTKEKALMNRIYVVAKYSIEPLLKNRGEFMKDKPAATTPPAENGGADPAASPSLLTPPGAPTAAPAKREPITATTPPISVDLTPSAEAKAKVEAKPADPKPAAEIKIPEPAPAKEAPAKAEPKKEEPKKEEAKK